ncbi:NADPH-dependent 7-cyano-7-deazaguanine reductase QueF [Ketobacter sp. MCCC 1A13808]|uniref:NADPH-dependent 7-cyano-7-deazaguanine reductase QueF n=1 Tax=Ketobacter sp. MCCC 1A13808 TaxID=2602738 RepID=UPI000F2D1FE4|nr:NADPH-dependent 7-cyano-7-deazaguanine reductase QueF [Ketobacter sp. MCCC 1A13808]MVF12604.1 NADPH-dependent 7-cyano-7-deazaguanine reductase QueF [Ketobacter sp. MCCC 1A13808]RLP55597.1 MAG: NADPH-dependent 7-cyano-7-deazaguanine reductase QueF [Ketobacter sp.]
MIEHGPLGQKSEHPQQYNPGVLFAIPRRLGRLEIGIGSELPFKGADIWNAYEVSWLTPKGKPVVAVMEMKVPADSSHIVESKSLKLYLGSFNQTGFSGFADVEQCIVKDVSEVVGAPVQVTLLPLTAAHSFTIESMPGRCVDELDIVADEYSVNARLLRVNPDENVNEQLHSHLLRSCCPVTGQPDWGSVLIGYQGNKIDEASLLRYLVSFRNNQEFHEQCVERIYLDIMQQCSPRALSVYARYTRRGGIDINPFRSSEEVDTRNLRLVRQ